ncbi:MAG: MBL fold metallo-hydrolase [Ruminiclostridium sp.]|nr:MBL fold metallo-hydrolase [Ruminiclostridium sp.]
MSEANFKIFRGSHQIGGCCSEFRLGDRRIVIDFGANLPGTDDPEIDDEKLVNTVFGNGSNIAATDAVLFTHYHGDHVGLKRHVPESVPMYIGGTAKNIMKIIASRVDYRNEKTGATDAPKMPVIERMIPYPKGGKSLDFSGISVTPLYIDHSALDSYMFVVEMCGKRILYTGDFREHGIPGSDRFDRLIKKYVGKVDILITEGTMLSRLEEAKKNPVQTEDDLGREAEKVFAAHHENVVIVSSTNVDSVMEFYHHTPQGMAFLCDAVQAEIMQEAIASKNFGNYSYRKNIYVLCQNNYKGYMRNLHDPHIKMADETKYNKNGFVMLVRPNNPRFRELLDKMKDPHITYSMWDGYLKGKKCEDAKLVEFLNGYYDDKHFAQLHTSGHAYVETLAKLIEMTQPETIIPMHTESADEFAEIAEFRKYSDRVKVLRDGDEYKIN